MRRLCLLALLCALPIAAQTTTTYTGTIKDLTGTVVTSGRVSFTLKPPGVSNITGIGSFVGNTVSCLINSSGQPVSSSDGTSPCTVVNNTALSPTGTYYNVCIQPYNVTPGSCLNVFAIGGTVDITTLVPTPATQPSFGQGLPGPTGPQGPMGCVVGQTCATVMPIAGGAFTGTVTGPLINGVIGAAAYSATTVTAPTQAAGLQAFTAGQEGSSGGSVAANNYRCEITYIGASGGETTPSSPSGLVAAAANSALNCAANDAPAGASGYNVYFQTGGSGNYYLSHSNVQFGVQDAQVTTPPTSGTTPPGSNTATSVLSAAQAALSGGPGAIAIPYGATGNPGDPAIGQVIFDYRTGSILQRMAIGSPQKSATGSVMNYGISQDIVLANGALSTGGQQMNGIGISIQQGNGGPVYGYGLPPFPSTVGLFARQYRFGTNSNATWTENLVNWVGNQNANAYVAEWDCYNDSGSAATGDTGCTGLSLLSEGIQSANNAIFVSGAKPWNNGLVIDADSVNNAGILIGANNYYGIFNESSLYEANNTAATSGTTSQAAPGLYFQSNVWHAGASVSDSFALYPSYGTGTDPVRIFNFAVPDVGSSGGTIWGFNAGPVRAVYNASYAGSGYFNADAGYQINGTTVLAASASMPGGSFSGVWVNPSPSSVSTVIYSCYLGTCTAVTVP